MGSKPPKEVGRQAARKIYNKIGKAVVAFKEGATKRDAPTLKELIAAFRFTVREAFHGNRRHARPSLQCWVVEHACSIILKMLFETKMIGPRLSKEDHRLQVKRKTCNALAGSVRIVSLILWIGLGGEGDPFAEAVDTVSAERVALRIASEGLESGRLLIGQGDQLPIDFDEAVGELDFDETVRCTQWKLKEAAAIPDDQVQQRDTKMEIVLRELERRMRFQEEVHVATDVLPLIFEAAGLVWQFIYENWVKQWSEVEFAVDALLPSVDVLIAGVHSLMARGFGTEEQVNVSPSQMVLEEAVGVLLELIFGQQLLPPVLATAEVSQKLTRGNRKELASALKACILMLHAGARACAYEVEYGGDVSTTGLAVVAAALKNGLPFLQTPDQLPDEWEVALAWGKKQPDWRTDCPPEKEVEWRERLARVREARRDLDVRHEEAVQRAVARVAAGAAKDEPPPWEPALDSDDEAFDPIPKDPSAGVRIPLPGAPPKVPWLVQAYLEPLLAMVGAEPYELIFEYGRGTGPFNANDFHAAVDGKGPTLSVILTQRENVFGAFAIPRWSGRDVFLGDVRRLSFLFTLVNERGVPPTKFPIRDASGAIWGHAPFGPCFGYQDVVVNGSGHGSFGFPHAYFDVLGVGAKIFDGADDFEVKLLEVWNFEHDQFESDTLGLL